MRRGLAAAALLGCALAAAGCATQDQLRQTEVQSAEQGQAVRSLQSALARNEAAVAELRGDLKRARDSVHGLEVGVTEARARADAARGQADNALSISKEFLANLVAAREEQRRQLEENGAAFADLGRRLNDLESRLQAQQRLLEQNSAAFNDANRRLAAVEQALAEAGRKAAALEARAKTGQETDDALSRQLATMRKQLDETRAVIGSEAMLQLMRQLDGVQSDAASLRGSLEELQQAQTEASTRLKNYYLDLDSRVRLLQQQLSQRTAQPVSPAAQNPPVAGAAAAESPPASAGPAAPGASAPMPAPEALPPAPSTPAAPGAAQPARP